MKFLVLASIAALLLAACSGGGGESKPGAASPEAAVRDLLDAIARQDDARIEANIDPYYSSEPAEVGVGDLIRLSELSDEFAFKDLDVAAEMDSTQEHARVFVDTRVVTEEGEATLDGKVLLTSKIEGRWYVTSQNSEHWASQLRPRPEDWALMQADASPSLPGQYFPPHHGADGVLLHDSRDDRAHFANDHHVPICSAEQIAAGNISNPLCYTSNPPTSGPHASSAAPFRVFSQPVGKEFLVHSMEHGGVVIWYNSNDPAVIQKLVTLTETNLARGKQVVLTPYTEMEASTVAITAWTRLDKVPAANLDIARLQRFIDAHERRFNPEGF